MAGPTGDAKRGPGLFLSPWNWPQWAGGSFSSLPAPSSANAPKRALVSQAEPPPGGSAAEGAMSIAPGSAPALRAL